MAKQCELCHQNFGLLGMNVVSYNKKKWHGNCFRCTSCNKQLTLNSVESVEDRIYCSLCNRSLQPQSGVSRQPITPVKSVRPPQTPAQSELTRRSTTPTPVKPVKSPQTPAQGTGVPTARKEDERPPRSRSVQVTAVGKTTKVPTSEPEARKRQLTSGASATTRSSVKTPPETCAKRIAITVVRGSICEQMADVIVNSIGIHHDLLRGALSAALLNHAGPELQDDLNKQATLSPTSRVYVTEGHGLKCRHVIHVICGGYTESKESNQNFCSLVDELLRTADSLDARSIAIPPIGTGNLGYPASFVAKMIVKGIDDHASSCPQTHLQDVRFVMLETDKGLLKEFGAVTDQRDQKPLLKTDQGPLERQLIDEINRTTLRRKLSTVFPSTWIISETDKNYERLVINADSSEYKQVVRNMTESDGELFVDRICKIARVENKRIYGVYEAYKQQLLHENTHRTGLIERTLWHGTADSALDSICQYGFNRSYCGKNGTLYGQGVYYARDFSYSARGQYSPADNYNLKCVIQCRVLTGTSTNGDEDMLEPPEMSPGKRYDSTVDEITDPAIFVIYNDFSVYPEYVIWFSDEKDI